MLEFWLLAIYGAFNMVRGARKMRAARKYRDFTLAWSERPLSSLKYDTISWIAISIHWISVVVIGLIEVLILATRPLPAAASSFLFIFILFGIIPAVGYIWGSILFYPVAIALAGDRYLAISPKGVLWAGNLIPWSAFSYFGFDREKNIIRLWSDSLRGTIAFMFTPPQEHISGVIDILQSHLQNEDTVSPPSFIEQCIFPILMAVGCIPIVIMTYLMLQLPLEITLIVNGVLMYVLMILGGPVLLRSLLGKETQPAVIE
jgi:hypothetical protein